MGKDTNDVVSHKHCGFQGRAGGRIVMMEPAVVAPKFWSFSLHIFYQASQNIKVKVRVDHSARRNKFTVNNPLHVEENNGHALQRTPDVPHLFSLLEIVDSSTTMIVALFLDHNCKTNFRHPS
jgi:hypothetical protein